MRRSPRPLQKPVRPTNSASTRAAGLGRTRFSPGVLVADDSTRAVAGNSKTAKWLPPTPD
ncbi:MAG: hypothetical protein H6663_02345 [Candidatus Promineofilum sp.]|nr:hypothetical protein [Promineifilum sp.]MCO5179674.1 hypothetical protein [Promineifilum sp.]